MKTTVCAVFVPLLLFAQGLGFWSFAASQNPSPPQKPALPDDRSDACVESLAATQVVAANLAPLSRDLRQALVRWHQAVSKVVGDPGVSDRRQARGIQSLREVWREIRGFATVATALLALTQQIGKQTLSDTDRQEIYGDVLSGIVHSGLIFRSALSVRRFHEVLRCASCSTARLNAQAMTVVHRVGTRAYEDVMTGQTPLKDSARAEVRIWLQYLIQNQVLSADEWRRMIGEVDDNALLAIADATDRKWQTLGISSQDVLNVGRRLLGADWPYSKVARVLGLTVDESRLLEDGMSPIQWVEYRHLRHALTENDMPEFESRVDRYASSSQRYAGGDIKAPLLGLLYDNQIPYELFERIRARLESRWKDWYGDSAHLGLHFDKASTPASALPRAERYFGRSVVHPDEVWAEAKQFAQQFGSLLEHGPFASSAEFVAFFKLERHYLPPQRQVLDFADERRMQIRAVAEVYFRILHQRLGEFLDLEPTAAEVRWMLETPLQFPVSLHEDRVVSVALCPRMATSVSKAV